MVRKLVSKFYYFNEPWYLAAAVGSDTFRSFPSTAASIAYQSEHSHWMPPSESAAELPQPTRDADPAMMMSFSPTGSTTYHVIDDTNLMLRRGGPSAKLTGGLPSVMMIQNGIRHYDASHIPTAVLPGQTRY